MKRLWAVFLWELQLGFQNRLLHGVAGAGALAGVSLWVLAPAPEPVPMLLIQVLLFFGSLFAILLGWASGQQVRAQGAVLLAQPIHASELVGGKLLGVAVWCAGLLVLLMGPVAVGLGLAGPAAALGTLGLGLLVVCAAAGLALGLNIRPVAGLLATLLVWAVAVAGWELGLLYLAGTPGIAAVPGLFVALLLVNPLGVFRVGAMVGLEAVPLEAEGLGVWEGVFGRMGVTATAVFALWTAALVAVGAWALRRQEF